MNLERSDTHCRGCWIEFILGVLAPNPRARENHHVFFLSKYKKRDKDYKRNRRRLCFICHRDAIKWVHGLNKQLDMELKEEALMFKAMKAPIRRKKSKKIKKAQYSQDNKAKNQAYNESIKERFKEKHEWLSPSQWKYRQDKLYLAKRKLNE